MKYLLYKKIKQHVKLINYENKKQGIMETTINQRIREMADKLCDGNISELARVVGVNQPALREVVGKKQVKPSFETLSKIVANMALGINAEWLLTGKGGMQTHSIDIIHKPRYHDVGYEAIPIYDINGAANLQTLFANNNQEVLGEIKIPNAPACDGAIYVRGDSMYPLIKSGDMVSYKQLHNIENLVSDQMYVVDFDLDGDDFLVIKYVKWEERNATLRLISYNEDHQDMIIPVGAVRAIALIKIIIRVNSMF